MTSIERQHYTTVLLSVAGFFQPVYQIEYIPAPALKRFTKKRPVKTPRVILL